MRHQETITVRIYNKICNFLFAGVVHRAMDNVCHGCDDKECCEWVDDHHHHYVIMTRAKYKELKKKAQE